jgi:type I restriction enzyme S subunit
MIGQVFSAYSEYKDSGIDWLGNIPKHWQKSKLKNFYEVCLGKMLQSSALSSSDRLVPYLRAANVLGNGKIDTSDIREMWFSQHELNVHKLIKGDLIVSEGGDVGRSAIWNEELEECYIQNAVHRVRSKGDCSNKFLYYWMVGLKNTGYIDILCNKATIAHLTFEKIKEIPFLYPSLSEQKQIATFLDRATTEIDQIIEQQKQLIALLEEERTTVISHAVTKGLDPSVPMKDSGIEWLGEIPKHWDVKRLKHTCSVIKDGTHQPPQRTENGFPLLSVRNIIDGKFVNLEDDSLISEQDFKELQRSFTVQENDVLLAIVGATLGKVAIVEEMPPFTIQRSLAFFRPCSPILYYRYLSAFLQSSIFQRLLWKNVGFSAQPGIYLGVLGNLHTLIPPISEQQVIASFLDQETAQIDEAIDNVRSQIEKLEEYRTVLISDAVTGKIDVRGFS